MLKLFTLGKVYKKSTKTRLKPPPPPSWGVFLCEKINSGTRRRIEIFQKSKMIRIENPKLLAWFQTPQTVSRPSRPNFQPHRTVEHTSQKLVSLQPPFTLKLRPKGAKTTAGLVPATSDRFQTVQTQLGFQPELLVFQTIFNSMPLSIPG